MMRTNKSSVIIDHLTGAELAQLLRQVIREELNRRFQERDYFSDRSICTLFEVSRNTPSNWRKGHSAAPEGFFAACKSGDYKALLKCARRYKAHRAKCDVLNTKKVVRFREGSCL